MLSRKSQGLSLTTIVIAALALLVLVILTVVLAGRLGLFNKGLKHCDTICVESSTACEAAGYEVPVFLGSCDDGTNKITENAYCCKEASRNT